MVPTEGRFYSIRLISSYIFYPHAGITVKSKSHGSCSVYSYLNACKSETCLFATHVYKFVLDMILWPRTVVVLSTNFQDLPYTLSCH